MRNAIERLHNVEQQARHQVDDFNKHAATINRKMNAKMNHPQARIQEKEKEERKRSEAKQKRLYARL